MQSLGFIAEIYYLVRSNNYLYMIITQDSLFPDYQNIFTIQRYYQQFLYNSMMNSQISHQNSFPQFKCCNRIVQLFEKENTYGNLFLGSVQSLSEQVIESLKIKAVLTVMDQYIYGKRNISQQIKILQIKQHKWIQAEDDEKEKIDQYFQQSYQFIDKNLKQQNVLVHCQAGISRSATFVIYYVMKKLNLTLQSANKLVVSKRHKVSPNQGFWNQLEIQENKIKSQQPEKNMKENTFRGKILDPISKFSTEEYPQKFANHIVCLNPEGFMENENLFLGQFSILKSHFLKSLKINSIISVVEESFYKRMKVKEIIQHQNIKNHMWLDIEDKPNQPLNKHFDETFEFINNHLKEGNVLVHCQAGVSRSASIVIAYIIRKFKVDFQNALSFVQSKRKYVKPNEGFQLHLIEYSQKQIQQ